MSGVTPSSELAAIHAVPGVSAAGIVELMRNGAKASFLPASDRDAALAALADCGVRSG